MGGYIMQTQGFSVNDGEGIRTIVFMAGCPLRCAWCANPEGQTCRNALTRYADVDELVQEIRRHDTFYRYSGGGVTFSGGEATAQPEFLAALVDQLYDEGYNLALETCGEFDYDTLEPTLRRFDLIFMDLKQIDSALHERYTGVPNARILENLSRTAALGVPLVIRIPAIGGVNADDASMRGAFSYIRDHCPGASLELLPYHRYGEAKYDRLGMPRPTAAFTTPSQDDLHRWEQIAQTEYGIPVVRYR